MIRSEFDRTTTESAFGSSDPVVVTRNNIEVQFFLDRDDARVFVQHFYGMTENEAVSRGIKIMSIKLRPPQAGDGFIYDGKGEFNLQVGGRGVLHLINNCIAGVFNAKTFRRFDQIDFSGGGPIVFPGKLTLKMVDIAHAAFWMWPQGFAGGKEGHYSIPVPLWRWNGKQASSTEDVIR